MKMVHKYLKDVVTLNINREKCIGCSLCVQVCPHRVLQMNERKVEIRDKDRCIECGACANNCPTNAIFLNPGVG